MNTHPLTGWLAQKLRLLVVIALMSGLALNVGPVQVAQAAALEVTRFDDPIPDGCLAGDCSLREAIRAANASAGADSIHLHAGTYVLTLAGAGEDAAATGDLDITGELTIEGEGWANTTLFSGVLDRVFEIQAGATAEIRAVNINNGKAGNDNGAASATWERSPSPTAASAAMGRRMAAAFSTAAA